MSDTNSEVVDVAPPRDYGGGDQWADDGDYYVPDDLRPFYAGAEPSDADRAGYIKNGVSTNEDVDHEVLRVIAPGRADAEAVTTTEHQTVTRLVDLAGASGYPRWLHMRRLGLAQQAKKRDDFRQIMESHHETCSVCQIRSASVRTDRVHDVGGSYVLVVGCPTHLPLLVSTARDALAARAADQTLPDGRRVGDVAASVIDDEIATQLDEQEATG